MKAKILTLATKTSAACDSFVKDCFFYVFSAKYSGNEKQFFISNIKQRTMQQKQEPWCKRSNVAAVPSPWGLWWA